MERKEAKQNEELKIKESEKRMIKFPIKERFDPMKDYIEISPT